MSANVKKSSGSGLDAPRTLVVVPVRAADALADPADWRWLSGAGVRRMSPATPVLERILAELAQPPALAGRAALRLWGQTGRRPAGWVAAADPVSLQAGLENVFLHVPLAADIEAAALRTLLADLQRALLTDRDLRFEVHDECGYLRGGAALPVAELPANAIDRARLPAFMPAPDAADADDYYALRSEIEMFLFNHPHNQDRERRGQQPLNALWLWGGGSVESLVPRTLPIIITDDALLKGFTHYSESAHCAWPGSLSACNELAPGDFVAVPPALGADQVQALLAELRGLWQQRVLASVTLLFDDYVLHRQRTWSQFLRQVAGKNLRKEIDGKA